MTIDNPSLPDENSPSGGEKSSKKRENAGNAAAQFFGGIGAAIGFEWTGEPLVPTPEKFNQPNRQDFHEVNQRQIKRYSGDGGNKYALRQAKLHEGQNSAQEAMKQPLPRKTIEPFHNHVQAHAVLDHITEKKATQAMHDALDDIEHEEVKNSFVDTGQPAGENLHKVGKTYSLLKGVTHKAQQVKNDPSNAFSPLMTEEQKNVVKYTALLSKNICVSDPVIKKIRRNQQEEASISTADSNTSLLESMRGLWHAYSSKAVESNQQNKMSDSSDGVKYNSSFSSSSSSFFSDTGDEKRSDSSDDVKYNSSFSSSSSSSFFSDTEDESPKFEGKTAEERTDAQIDYWNH